MSKSPKTPQTVRFHPASAVARLLVLLLSVALLATPATAWAAGEASISIDNLGELAPGTELSVPVSITDNPGFAAAVLSLDYDHDALELLSFAEDGLLANGQINNVAADTIGYMGLKNVTSDGLLFSANFRVKDNAAGGDYSIEIGLKDGVEKNFANFDAEVVPVSFVPGSLAISGNGSAGNGSGAGSGAASDNPSNTGSSAGSGDSGGGDSATTGDDTGSGESGAGSGSDSAELITPAKTVVATSAAGDTRELMIRETTAGRQYSLDAGQTWSAVPTDGIINTEDGQQIVVDENGEAILLDAGVPAAQPEAGFPLLAIAIIAAVLVLAAVLAIFLIRRRRAPVPAQSSIGKHSRAT